MQPSVGLEGVSLNPATVSLAADGISNSSANMGRALPNGFGGNECWPKRRDDQALTGATCRRGISIAGQRSITTCNPAASARAAAASSITPNCIHTALAPIAIA